jgi:hypothetical protein
MFENMKRMTNLIRRAKNKLKSAALLSSQEATQPIDFVCNVCGSHNYGVALERVSNRECQSCIYCGSSLRMRSVIYALSIELFDKPIVLPEFPNDSKIIGLGMSDWDGYAAPLAKKLAYTNTFYHTDPRLDITAIPERLQGKQRFLISSDVFEHIPGHALDAAFYNSRRLLGPDGFFLFTVPFTKSGNTVEHFPSMYDFRVIETAGKRFLYNVTKDGKEEIYDQLIFHGGDGMTLEMRVFSEPDLVQQIKKAGFSSIRIYRDVVPEYGILWPIDWAVPVVARV